MSIWGKIVGTAAGFAMGGPIGALLGVVAGHAVDKMKDDTERSREAIDGDAPPTPESLADGTKQIAFTIAVIVLGAKMAKADGVVTRSEVEAFKEVFHVPPEEMRNVGRLFNQARRDARGFEPYAQQIARLFRDNPAVLEELLDGLFHIARADGNVSAEEVAYLETVARIFGFDRSTWERIRAANTGEPNRDPYAVIGVDPKASDAEIKGAYRQLVRDNHPDKLMAEGMPEEFIAIANEKVARINAAYDEIRKTRGL